MVNQSTCKTALVRLVAQMAPLNCKTPYILARPHTPSLVLLGVTLLLAACPLTATQDLILQKCMPKADMENVRLKCTGNEMIAIHTAFFTSSIVDQCPFTRVNRSRSMSNEIDDILAKHKQSCTDDLRMTLNQMCSGRSSCAVNLRKAHVQQCEGFDGWINIKYSCVSGSRMHAFCNLDLTDNFGYVSNPGYPKFYPPYVCKWKIKAFPGQRIQIDILDLAIKEPKPSTKKGPKYECIDYVGIIEDNARVATLCGEVKSNLIEYRTKSDQLSVEFVSYDFSPTRGVLFKYSLLNCPTLRPPAYGDMYRNGSFAYYSCHFDFVFEDTGLQNLVLYCEYDTYWNGTVSHCVPKENVTVMAYALTHRGQVAVRESLDTQHDHEVKHFSKGLITPVILVAIVIVVNVVIILILVKLRQKSANRTAV